MSNQPPFDPNRPDQPPRGPEGQGGVPEYGSAPSQPGGYPGAPAEGGYSSAPDLGNSAHGGPAQVVEKPKSIALAVKLMFVGAALAALGVVIGLVTTGSDSTRDSIRDTLRDNNVDASESAIDSAVTIGMISTVVVGVIGVVLWLLMAKFNGDGKKWARIVATVLGALSVLSTLLSFTQPATGALTIVLNLVSLLLAIGILVLLWKPESTRYYQAQSAPRY